MLHLLRTWEEKCVGWVERHLPGSAPYLRRYQRLLRYLSAGGFGAAVDFLFLYLFTDFFDIHYLISAALAFLIAFVVSFVLQKFWTFQDESRERIHAQTVMYFMVALGNLFLNTLLMYLFVERVHLWYMTAQFLASGLIACESFFISRYIFKTRGIHSDNI